MPHLRSSFGKGAVSAAHVAVVTAEAAHIRDFAEIEPYGVKHALLTGGEPLLQRGTPELARALPGRMGWELRMVVQGGLCILDKCWRIDTYQTRPVLTWRDAPGMLWRALQM